MLNDDNYYVITKDAPDYALMVGVPAKQKGWVCECGEILHKFEKKVKCPKCGLVYEIKDEKLILKET